MLDARRLQILRAVAEHGSFSAAATALHLTQPAVSRHIAKLEREAGAQLVERSARGLRLTDAGDVLVEAAGAVAGELAAAERALGAVLGLERGRLRLSAFPSAGATLVVPALSEFRRRHPGVEIEFGDAEPRTALRLVREAELDLAVVYGATGEAPDDGLERVPLLVDRMVLALPTGHRLAAGKSAALAGLAAESWLVGARGQGLIRAACVAAGFEPRVVARTDHQRITLGLVAAGVGITLVPGLAAPRSHPGVVFVRVEPAVERAVVAVIRRTARPPAVTAILEQLAVAADRFLSDAAAGTTLS